MQVHTYMLHVCPAGIEEIRPVQRRLAGREKDIEMPSLGRFRL